MINRIIDTTGLKTVKLSVINMITYDKNDTNRVSHVGMRGEGSIGTVDQHKLLGQGNCCAVDCLLYWDAVACVLGSHLYC